MNTMMSLPCTAVEAGLRLYSRVAPTERGTYRLVRMTRRLRPRDKWKDVFSTSDRVGMDLDLATYPDCCMAFGLYELTTARLIKRLLRPGDHFVDGGANIGYFTMIGAKRVGRSGRVDAFEPEPENRARLQENLRRNGLADAVKVHNLALLDSRRSVEIHSTMDSDPNHGSASLFVEEGSETRASTVEGVRMDQVLAQTRPRVIKLDIEGAEALAVEGMKGLLDSSPPPVVIAEYNAEAAQIAGFEPRAFVDRLLQAQPRYTVSVIGWRLRQIEPTDETLKALGQVNLCFDCQ